MQNKNNNYSSTYVYNGKNKAPQPNNYNQYQKQPQKNKDVSIGGWFVTMLLMCIPLVNIVFYFMYIFGFGGNKTRCNLFRLSFILSLLTVGITIALVISLSIDVQSIITKLSEYKL